MSDRTQAAFEAWEAATKAHLEDIQLVLAGRKPSADNALRDAMSLTKKIFDESWDVSPYK